MAIDWTIRTLLGGHAPLHCGIDLDGTPTDESQHCTQYLRTRPQFTIWVYSRVFVQNAMKMSDVKYEVVMGELGVLEHFGKMFMPLILELHSNRRPTLQLIVDFFYYWSLVYSGLSFFTVFMAKTERKTLFDIILDLVSTERTMYSRCSNVNITSGMDRIYLYFRPTSHYRCYILTIVSSQLVRTSTTLFCTCRVAYRNTGELRLGWTLVI